MLPPVRQNENLLSEVISSSCKETILPIFDCIEKSILACESEFIIHYHADAYALDAESIKNIINESKIKSIGFNGVMFSLLEDYLLSKNNNKREFSIDSLISYSTVCGCGLDMIPLPGDIFEEEIISPRAQDRFQHPQQAQTCQWTVVYKNGQSRSEL